MASSIHNEYELFLDWSIWARDETLTNVTTSGQGEAESNGNWNWSFAISLLKIP